MAFSYKAVHLSENPCYTLSRSGLIESPYIQTTRTRFVQPGKIEIDANERAVIEKRSTAFSFSPSSILSLTIWSIYQNFFVQNSNNNHFQKLGCRIRPAASLCILAWKKNCYIINIKCREFNAGRSRRPDLPLRALGRREFRPKWALDIICV